MAPPRQGTGFINWGNFVNANRGSINRMADELSSPLEAEGARLQGAESDYRRQFDQGVSTALNPVRNLQYGMPGGGSEGAQWAAREKQLLDVGTTAYGGPRSLADVGGFNDALGQADRTAAGARQLADVYGRAAALGQRYGASGAPYTGGARLFDSALLQSGPAQQRFEQGRAQFGNLGGQYRTALGESATAGADAARGYGEAAKGAREAGERMKTQRESFAEQDRKEAERDEAWRKRNPGAGAGRWPGIGVPNSWGGLI